MEVVSHNTSEHRTPRNRSVVNGRVGVRCGHHQTDIPRQRHNFRNFRISTLNVGTMRGRSGEVVEIVFRRKVDICCLQETR